jgi:hypothetical protein
MRLRRFVLLLKGFREFEELLFCIDGAEKRRNVTDNRSR